MKEAPAKAEGPPPVGLMRFALNAPPAKHAKTDVEMRVTIIEKQLKDLHKMVTRKTLTDDSIDSF